ncbi:hypothetical protein LAUMK136_02614 [Mycobacterium attenuatum]|uniref:Uncharacterized protein n=1 Tax=Mycobacterium attenuatum TaxID=2341086 RepID=A0A498Q0D8_9MYCO|nr:hypothetical protein LAUMK136_02614 [Mycobacterium attenuatum]
MSTVPAGPTHQGAGAALTPGTPGSTIADQAGVAPGTAGLAGSTRRAVPAVAEQQSTGLSGCARRGPIGAVADQRSPQQQIGGRIDEIERLLRQELQHVCGLSAGVVTRAGVQRRDKLLMKRFHLVAERLIGLRLCGKQRRDGRRHLVGARRQHRCCGCRGRRVRRAQRCAKIRHIPRRRSQYFWDRHQVGHRSTPTRSSSTAETTSVFPFRQQSRLTEDFMKPLDLGRRMQLSVERVIPLYGCRELHHRIIC